MKIEDIQKAIELDSYDIARIGYNGLVVTCGRTLQYERTYEPRDNGEYYCPEMDQFMVPQQIIDLHCASAHDYMERWEKV